MKPGVSSGVGASIRIFLYSAVAAKVTSIYLGSTIPEKQINNKNLIIINNNNVFQKNFSSN